MARPTSRTAQREEVDELLATSKRLIEEARVLIERAKQLREQRVQIVKPIKNRT